MCAGKNSPEGFKLDEPKLRFSEDKKLETKELRGRNARFLLKSKGDFGTDFYRECL